MPSRGSAVLQRYTLDLLSAKPQKPKHTRRRHSIACNNTHWDSKKSTYLNMPELVTDVKPATAALGSEDVPKNPSDAAAS
jgi:hypothetical protein